MRVQYKAGYLKTMKVLHLALLGGQCLALGIALFLVIAHKIPPVAASLDKTLQVVALILAFAAVITATSMYKSRLVTINSGGYTTADKLLQYRTANVMRWMLTELAALFSIACFLVTSNYSFMALALGLIIFYALLAPGALKIVLQLQLSQEELDTLQ